MAHFCVSISAQLFKANHSDINKDISEAFPCDLDVRVSVVALYRLPFLCMAGSPGFLSCFFCFVFFSLK